MNVRECYVVRFQQQPVFRSFNLEKAQKRADELNAAECKGKPAVVFLHYHVDVEYVVELTSRHGDKFFGRVDLVSIDD